VPPKPSPELAEREASCAGAPKSAPRSLVDAYAFKGAPSFEPSGSVRAARCGTHPPESPSELSAEDFEEIVEVFQILKRWRDEARRGTR
jgi:hypothetical protein